MKQHAFGSYLVTVLGYSIGLVVGGFVGAFLGAPFGGSSGSILPINVGFFIGGLLGSLLVPSLLVYILLAFFGYDSVEKTVVLLPCIWVVALFCLLFSHLDTPITLLSLSVFGAIGVRRYAIENS